MARPARFAQRERGEVNAVKEQKEDKPLVQLGGANDLETKKGPVAQESSSSGILDAKPDSGQSSRRGLVGSEADPEAELERRIARRLGWVPKEEWTRDPAKWTDARAYLERTPSEVENLKERLKRNSAEAERALAVERQRAREEAEQALRAAAKSGDEEKAVQAAKGLAAASGPDPRTVAWASKNPWFKADPVATALAKAIVDTKAQSGASIEDQLQAAEDEVRRRFPEHFGERTSQGHEENQDTRREVRLSEVRAPALAGGSRSYGGRTEQAKEKGWNELPSEVKAAQSIFVRNMMRRGQTESQAREVLARGYWKNLGE